MTIHLTAAVSDYDHVRDLWTGAVFEQGICERRLTPDELFPGSVLSVYRV